MVVKSTHKCEKYTASKSREKIRTTLALTDRHSVCPSKFGLPYKLEPLSITLHCIYIHTYMHTIYITLYIRPCACIRLTRTTLQYTELVGKATEWSITRQIDVGVNYRRLWEEEKL